MRRLATDRVALHDHQTHGGRRDGTAGMHKAEVADLQKAIGQDMLKDPTAQCDHIEAGGTLACPSGFAVGDGAVLEAHEAAVDASFEEMGGVGRPERLDGNLAFGETGALFGLTEGALDAGARPSTFLRCRQ